MSSAISRSVVSCCGASRGRERTFVLLDEWVPASRHLSRDEALATLAERYFASHGPATLRYFTWWSGLLVRDAGRAVRSQVRACAGGRWCRPRSRSGVRLASGARSDGDAPAALGRVHRRQQGPLARFREARSLESSRPRSRRHTLVLVDGGVRGAWRRDLGSGTVRVRLDLWTRLRARRRAVERAAQRYAEFLGRELEPIDR